MNDLIEAIRAATATDATDDVKAAGANACRMILAALEATPGQPLVEAVPTTTPIQMAVSALRGVPPEQLLDVAIARLRAALPADVAAPTVAPVRFQILPLGGLTKGHGPKAGGS